MINQPFCSDDFIRSYQFSQSSKYMIWWYSYIQALPNTSYFKLVDWWLTFCLIILAVTLGFHTYLAYLINNQKNNQNNEVNVTKVEPFNDNRNENHLTSQKLMNHVAWLNKLGNIIFITFLILFNILFWTVALIEHFKSSEDILARHQ